ncbi:DUF4325 domain-containing protein [Acinetobacter sp. LoGeW2-3]|uniref:STAS-like domain-containing protein n=1 Tax=Acinetobacter sp. LoGeW2-3 TaxID=1808001 RepID=UPI000C059CB7|nr:STAS-like domain-containing protein [Acinetobacter sp. LoGeW2-3]ATO18299.1 DUF4325 domain-containing protein [Acinetobacter sp. LoGeW2-3]
MMEDYMLIDVAENFSDSPSGRYSSDGKYSGENFLNLWLLPNISKYKKIILDFSGVLGYGSSFLEEAFGGLVRKTNMSKDEFTSKIEIRSSNDPFLISEINQYVDEELKRNKC